MLHYRIHGFLLKGLTEGVSESHFSTEYESERAAMKTQIIFR